MYPCTRHSQRNSKNCTVPKVVECSTNTSFEQSVISKTTEGFQDHLPYIPPGQTIGTCEVKKFEEGNTCRTYNICNNPFAYRQHISTTDALIVLLEHWTEALEPLTTSHVQAVCLDFSKAFDRMSHNLVLTKLQHLGASPRTVTLVQSFLIDREQSVKFSTEHSSCESVTVGAPQERNLVHGCGLPTSMTCNLHHSRILT